MSVAMVAVPDKRQLQHGCPKIEILTHDINLTCLAVSVDVETVEAIPVKDQPACHQCSQPACAHSTCVFDRATLSRCALLCLSASAPGVPGVGVILSRLFGMCTQSGRKALLDTIL